MLETRKLSFMYLIVTNLLTPFCSVALKYIDKMVIVFPIKTAFCRPRNMAYFYTQEHALELDRAMGTRRFHAIAPQPATSLLKKIILTNLPNKCRKVS